MSDPHAWLLTYDGYRPQEEGLREALCTVGNGYFATRGALPESASDAIHHPGTYVAGVYNRLVTEVAGRDVDNESLVNAPNWLPLRFRAEGGEWFGCDTSEVLEHHLELDVSRGLLTRRSRLTDPDGRIVTVAQRRFVSMRDPHLAGLSTAILPENWSGRLEIRSGLDGAVRNDGVPRYAELDDVHLTGTRTHRHADGVLCLSTHTSQSRITMAMAARTTVVADGPVEALPEAHDTASPTIELSFVVDVDEGAEVLVEKVVSVFTSRDRGISEPSEEACDWVRNVAGSFEELFDRHMISWRHIWRRLRIEMGVDGPIAQALHLNLFHVIQTVSNNTVGLDAGVPARGLHGEAYRGHIFWDELFILPFLSLRMPQVARSLLLYRYRRLDQARRAAADAGYAGAMFPWQSASNGREETQTLHLNPKSGRWLPDASHRQRHVNAAIAFNIWNYVQASGDLDFLRFYGGEMMLEIARFWASIATYNHALDRYEITGVMGPDEYHEGYPDRDEPGLDNNSYTNLMAVWCIMRAFHVLDTLPPASARDLRERLRISQVELDRWGDVSRKMRICFHDGVMSQFEGFDELIELDRNDYIERYGDIHRMDRILEAEGDKADRYKIAKQADVMMLFYLLSPTEVSELLDRIGYDVDDGLLARSAAYYEPRTVHGSTLSRLVHAWVNARLDPERSWDLFVDALRSDLDDSQGGTTAEGIHLGAMAGAIDLLQRCYTGLETRGDVLRLNPAIPDALGRLAFEVRYRGHLVHLDLTTSTATIRVDPDEGAPITVEIAGERHLLRAGHTLEVALADPAGPDRVAGHPPG
ncbi:MAG: glycoside hydrolase family 65 protein [Planctomycetes bacterium]|nr:glycoside hydrolase family 65 protein [Planctomycetota bacterium]